MQFPLLQATFIYLQKSAYFAYMQTINFAFIGIADTPWRIFLQLLFLERVQTVH